MGLKPLIHSQDVNLEQFSALSFCNNQESWRLQIYATNIEDWESEIDEKSRLNTI